MAAAGTPQASALAQPRFWTLDRIADALGGGTVAAPVISNGELRWLREGVAMPIPGRIESALFEFERTLAATGEVVEFAMVADSMIVMNNRRTLHARTAVPDRGRSHRLVLRTKVYRPRVQQRLGEGA